jgi:peroxiredoxin
MPDCVRRTRRPRWHRNDDLPRNDAMDEEAPMTIQVGDKLPAANLKQLTADGIKDVSIGDLTRGKKLVLFAVPGAFTPTCSERHLPGFVEQAEALKGKGVDTIACVSVNDPFVMSAWEKARSVGGKVQMLSDGNGEFTRALGLEFDGSGFGLGKRSRRYAMVVEDGTVKTLLIEEVPSQAEASSASAILAAL